MTNEELYKNIFFKTILDFAQLTYKSAEIKDTDGKTKYKPYKDLSDTGKYILDIFNDSNRLSVAISDIEFSIVFLNRFPQKKFYLKHDLQEQDYIRYHLEVYLGKLFTISEVIKLMINTIYRLGLPDRECNSKNLKKKLGQQNPTIILLNDFDKQLDSYRHKRIKITHYGKFIGDREFDDISMYMDYYCSSDKFGLKTHDDFIPRWVAYYLTRKYRRNQAKLISQNLCGVRKFIDLFYSVWIDEFLENIEKSGT